MRRFLEPSRSSYLANFIAVLSFLMVLSGCDSQTTDHEKGTLAGVDGVSFDPVPTDVTIDCNYHILQGTQRFKGTYFVIPKVRLGKDREQKTAMKMLPLPNGDISLDFALNLTRGTETRELQTGVSDAERYADTCNFEQLRAAINKHYEELKQPENKVWSLSPLPITNIEVRIDGIGEPVLLSPPDTNITTWLGETISGSIGLNSNEAQRLLTKVSRGLGIQLVVAFKFEARETREYGSVTIKGADIASALESDLGYDGPAGAGVILESELKTKLASAIKKSSAEAVFESDDGKLSSAAESLMKLMIEKVSPETLLARDRDLGNRDDWDDEDDYYRRRREREREQELDRQERLERELERERSERNRANERRDGERDPWDFDRPDFGEAGARVRDRVLGNEFFYFINSPDKDANPASKNDAASGDQPKTNSRKRSPLAPMAFKVSAVLEFLRSQTDTKVEYRIMGKLVSETASTRSKMILAKVGARDESTVELTSGASQKVVGRELEAGKSIKLMIADKKTFVMKTQDSNRVYFSKSALLNLKNTDAVSLDFPQLVEWGRTVKEFTPNEMTGPRAFVYDSFWNPFNWSYYVWGKVDSQLVETMKEVHLPDESAESLDSHIRVTFSRIARRYGMSEIVNLAKSGTDQQKDLPFTVTAAADGSITITANQFLGSVMMENTETFPEESFVITRYFQEMWYYWSNARVAGQLKWSNQKRTKSLPSGRSVVSVRVLDGAGVPDVNFEEQLK